MEVLFFFNNPKKYAGIVILLVQFLLNTNSYSQTPSLVNKTKIGKTFIAHDEHPTTFHNFTSELIGFSEGKYYIFPLGNAVKEKDESGTVKVKYKLGVLDEHMQLLQSKDIFYGNLYSYLENKFESFLLWNNELLFFTSEQVGHTTSLYCQVVNKNTLIPGSKQLIQADSSRRVHSGYRFSISPDGYKLGVLCYGNDTRVSIYERQLENKIFDIDYGVVGTPNEFSIDDNGNGYVTEIHKNPSLKKYEMGVWNQLYDSTTYVLSSFYNTKQTYYRKEFSFSEKRIGSYCHIILNTSFKGWLLASIEGIYKSEIDTLEGNISTRTEVFPKDLYDRAFAISDQTIENHIKPELCIRNCFLQKDGSYIIIGEMMHKAFDPGDLQVEDSYQAQWRFEYKDIILFKYTKQQTVDWVKSINKNQSVVYSFDDHVFTGNNSFRQPLFYESLIDDQLDMSFFTVNSVGNSLYVMFNESSWPKANGEIVKSYFHESMVVCKIDQDSIVRNEIKYSKDLKKYFLVPSLSQINSENTALLFMRGPYNFLQYRHRYRLMEVNLN